MEAAWTRAGSPARGYSEYVRQASIASGMCFLLGYARKLGLPES